MSETPDRRATLAAFAAANPQQPFPRYALAMELARLGEPEAALAELETLNSQHPDYAAAWQQAAQLLIAAQRFNEARTRLERGIAAAQRSGDRHAASEMQGMLDSLPAGSRP